MTKEEYESKLFERIICSMKIAGLEKIASALVLTGSFGRNEPTYIIEGDSFRLKSDIEIGVIYKKDKRAAMKLIDEVSSQFEEDLNLMTLSQKRLKNCHNYNNTIFIPKYKTLFTFDLYNGSKTIWGHDFLKENKVTQAQVDLYEAKRIVANRIGELISIDADEETKAVWKGKLLLAIASAYLLCCGKYSSSYHEQRKQIEASEEALRQLFDDEFCSCYYDAFEFLRNNGEYRDFDVNALKKYTGCIKAVFNKLNLFMPRTNSMSRKIKYAINYAKSGFTIGFSATHHIEERIIDLLINNFSTGDDEVVKIADLWHKVLY